MKRNGYNSSTKAWGGEFWRVAHSITFQYSETNPSNEEKDTVITFFQIFPKLLPCWKCGFHFQQLLDKHPLTDDVLTNRNTLSRWLHLLHNKVNLSIGKKQIPYDEVAHFYLINMNNGLPRTPLYPMSTTALSDLSCTPCVLMFAGILAIALIGGTTAAILNARRQK